MRPIHMLILIAPLLLAACGSTEKTVVVNPPAGSTTVVDKDGHTTVVHAPD